MIGALARTAELDSYVEDLGGTAEERLDVLPCVYLAAHAYMQTYLPGTNSALDHDTHSNLNKYLQASSRGYVRCARGLFVARTKWRHSQEWRNSS